INNVIGHSFVTFLLKPPVDNFSARTRSLPDVFATEGAWFSRRVHARARRLAAPPFRGDRKMTTNAAKRQWRTRMVCSAIGCVALVTQGCEPRDNSLVDVEQSALGSANLVISQVYGGGGNSGATYKNDFIEIFNRGTAAVSVSGWSVQYASA